MSDSTEVRQVVEELLTAWETGARKPRQVFEDARALWQSRRWPQAGENGYDLMGMDVLLMLATARDGGLTDGDIPALREYASAKGADIEPARERFFDHLLATTREREAMQDRDDYYGPGLATEDDGLSEFFIPDPEGRRLHRAIRLYPEAGWGELRAGLCGQGPWDQDFLMDLVEDLMFSHAEQFIDRLERLAEDCPEARETIAHAYVGGLASTPALERFWSLQERLGGGSNA
jgi:hypothetical protein